MQEESSMDRKLAKQSLGQGKPVNNGDGGTKLAAKALQTTYQEYGSSRGRGNRQRRGYGQRERRPVQVRKSSYRGNGNRREESTQVEDVNTEGRRNLNHLLNFTLTPRHAGEENRRFYHKKVQDRPKFSKDRYLQANCQFVVQESEGYGHHLNDPDLLVNWDLIEQIRLRSNERPFCPICLEAPRAGRMTRCGHIYCWACVLQYLSKSPSAVWSKCPICEEIISRADLKSVLVLSHQQPTVGEEITFTLMRRGRNDIMAVPVVGYKEGITRSFPNMDSNHPLAPYSKLLVASDQEVLENIITVEKAELLVQLVEEEGEPVSAFIHDALNEFEGRMDKMLLAAPRIRLKDPNVKEELCEQMEQLSFVNNNKAVPVVYESAFDQVLASEQVGVATSKSEIYQGDEQEKDSLKIKGKTIREPEKRTRRNESAKQPKSTFYFYQASDGQMVFLHGLNIDMLVSAYGSLERCPLTLTGVVVELEETVMTENVRKKLRYLGHISIGSTFQVAEIDMKRTSYVHEQTLLDFNESLNRRRRSRERRARCEERREKRISDEARKKWPSYVKKTITKSAYHHPTSAPVIQGACPPLDTVVSEADVSTLNAETVDAPVISFAQMLRDGKTRSVTKPQVCKTETREPLAEGRARNNSTESEGDWVPPPEYHQSFRNSVTAAMESTVDSENGTEAEGRKKKRKKGKPQLLFSTSMARGNPH